LGTVGKVYIVKNQVSGNIKVKASGGQKIDTASDVNLGTNNSIVVVFDGTRWNVIE
jgi:deoxyribose-phosphate aldolase